MIILKNGEKSIVTIKAKVKSLVGQNDDITIENMGAVTGKDIETKISNIISNTLHNLSALQRYLLTNHHEGLQSNE